MVRNGLAVAVCVGAVAIAGLGVWAPWARASVRVDGSLTRVLTPHREGTVRGDAVMTRVRVSSRARSFSVRMGSREVRRRFVRRGKDGLRVARLRVGRAAGVRYGVNRLEVRARDRRGAVNYEVVDFAVVRRSHALLRLGGPRRGSQKALVRLRLATRRAVVSLRLNGRRIAVPESARPGRRLRVMRLDADEGLRHGRNALRVTAVDRVGGRYEVLSRTITMARTAPIPGAGHDRRGLTGRRVGLDARHTRAAYLPPSLRYRWRIVRKPRGSRATLLGATTRRPRLRPDVPGRYRLRMTVTEPIPGRDAARAAQASPAAASDTTTISATPDGTGIGVPVDTRGGYGRLVTVGDQSYKAPDGSKPLQLVVLDRSTLELVSNISFAGDAAGTASLADAVSGLPNSRTFCPETTTQVPCPVIAIIVTRALGNHRPPLTDNTALDNLNRAVAALGGEPIPAPAALTAVSCFEPTPVCGGFSVIGTRGVVPGEGAVNLGDGAINPGLGADDNHSGGALRGYLQLDQQQRWFTFVQGDHVPFDTAAPGTSPTQAVIQVGDATYKSPPLPAAAVAGAYVLVLDAGTLAFREHGTFALPGGPAASIPVDTVVHDEDAMALLLNKYKDDPSALVFVQTIGLPGRWDSQQYPAVPDRWNQVALSLQALGGHRTLFNALTDASYAQVAPGGPYAASLAKVASQEASQTPGRLSGTLARSETSQFYPDKATGFGKLSDELTVVAYQQPQPWPLRGTKAGDAALRCVAADPSMAGLTYPIEDNYTNLTLNFSDEKSSLDKLTYADLKGLSGCDTSSFTADYFENTVIPQLDDEFIYINRVRGLISDLKTVFLGSSSSPALNLATIADDINTSVNQSRPATGQVGYNGAAITEEVLYMVGAVAAVTGQEEIPIAIELLAAGMGLAADTTLDDNGRPELAPAITNVDIDKFAGDLAKRYDAAAANLDQMGDILVGDWGKLEAAGTKVETGGPWELKDGYLSVAQADLTLAAQRFAFTVLFPKAYSGLLRGELGDSTLGIPGDPSQYQCWARDQSGIDPWFPFSGMKERGGVTPVLSAGWPNERENWVFSRSISFNEAFNPHFAYGGGWLFTPSWSNIFPSATLLADMFAQPDDETPALLSPLAFVLSIRDQLHVLNIWRSTFPGFGSNTCEGINTAPPADL